MALARSAYAMYSDHTQHLARMYNRQKRRVSGINYLAVRVAFGDLTFEQSRHSLELLTEHVFPDLADLAPATASTTSYRSCWP